MLHQDFGHLCRNGRVRTSGHSDFGSFSILQMFTWVWADTASAAYLRIPGQNCPVEVST